MSNQRVLLREHVANLGRCGDVVEVAAGYARNYLIPTGRAVQATAVNELLVERRRATLEAEEALRNAETTARVDSLSAVVLSTTERADENGHLFGSVSAGSVAQLLTAAGHPVEERQVRLEHPIKEVGTFQVLIHVRGEANAEVTLEVLPSEE